MGWSHSQLQYLCEQYLFERLKKDIRSRAEKYAEQYSGRTKKVAYEAFLAGMESMSEMLEKK